MSDDPTSFDTSFRHIATLPEAWGQVVRFETRNGKLVAISASGDAMIVPTSDKKDSPATS